MSYELMGTDRSKKAPMTRMLAFLGGGALVLVGILFFAGSSSTGKKYFSTSSALSEDTLGVTTLDMRMKQADAIWERGRARQKKFEAYTGEDPPKWSQPQPYSIWDNFYPSWNSPWSVERVGIAGDGGKWITGMERLEQQKKCIVYSFGINHESSFEAEMLERTNCEIFGYDFSVVEFGPEVSRHSKWNSRAHFFPYMLTGQDDHTASPPKWTLQGLMKANGHDFVDILKVDIEGSEFAVIDSMLEHYKGRPLPFGQMQLEIHLWDQTPKSMRKWWRKLEDAGLRTFWQEINAVWLVCCGNDAELSEYSFINVRGEHPLISNAAFVENISKA